MATFNPTITVQDKSGSAKRIGAANISRDMRADASWYSSKASDITSVPTTLSNSLLEWVMWERNNWVKIKFASDSSSPNGQGFSVSTLGFNWTVDSVSGTVYIVRAKDITVNMTKADIYASSARVAASVGDTLMPGDAIVAASSSNFVLKIELPKSVPSAYGGFAAIQAALAQ